MTCDCMDKFDKSLEPMNTRLVRVFTLNGANIPAEYPSIGTEKTKIGRGKARSVIPTFCPFCGVRYRPEATQPEEGPPSGAVALPSTAPWQVYEEPCATREDFMREMAIQAEHTVVADPTLYLVHDGNGKVVASTWGGERSRANAYAIAAMSDAPPPPPASEATA